jgi:hypothetical protein
MSVDVLLQRFFACKYQAATNVEKTCMKHLALAEVLQVLNIIINTKKWMVPHYSGWHSLSFNIIAVDATTAASGKAYHWYIIFLYQLNIEK